MTRALATLLAFGLFASARPAAAAEDPCPAAGGVKVADTCDGYGSSCCSLDRTSRYWCETYGANDDLKATCMASCGGATCGWRCDENPLTGECITYPVALGAYACGQALQPDPSGDNPWTCKAFCNPQCGGKTCGPDGCGPAGQQGVCGQCISDPTSQCPMACNASGKCDKVCADCAALGWTCGSNCCGGICGSCAPPSTCSSLTHTCSCVPSCAGKACGDDGCGGSCGTCAGGLACEAGACVPPAAEPQPEVVDALADPGTPPDPGSADPGTPPDPGYADPGAPDPGTPGPDTVGDQAADGDGGCPDGSSLVSGICLKDPPRKTPRDGAEGGGCQAGATAGPAGWLALAGLVVVLAVRCRGEPG